MLFSTLLFYILYYSILLYSTLLHFPDYLTRHSCYYHTVKYSESEWQAMTMAARMKAKSDTDSATADTNNMDIEAYFGCKYLTSSDLLSLQIRDPSFRLQLAAQILFYINFLR